MEHDFYDHVLTLQEIMGSDSELEYITKERNLIPSMIEEICTELTEDKSDGAAYRSNVLVRKKSVDYFESLGYNLFRQFESEMSCEYFDRPTSTKSGQNMNGTVKFAIVTTLDYALDIFAYGLPSNFPSIWDSFGDYVRDSEVAFLPGNQNRIDHPTTSTCSRSSRNRSVSPVWGSTKRLPTSFQNKRLGSNSSLEEYPLYSEVPSYAEYFYKVTTLRSSLRDRYSNMSDFEDLNITESEDSNSGTTAISSTQNDTYTDSCASSGTMKHVNDSVTNSFETSTTQRNFNLSNLRVNDTSSVENNVENDVPVVRDGHVKHKYSATISFSPNLSEDNSSCLDSFEVATAAKMECRSPGNSSFQSTSYNCNTSNSYSYVQRTKCQESPLPLARNNYSEASKADEIQKENLYLSKGINYHKTSFSPTPLSDDNSSSSDLLEVATTSKMGLRNPGNSSFQSTCSNSHPSGFYDLRDECRNEKESRLSLNCSKNYSEADEVKNFYLPKKINDLENQFDSNLKNIAKLAVSLDAFPEDFSSSVKEQEDSGLFNRENSFYPKHIALKRSASSPASSPRSSFRSLRNPKKGRLSQPDSTDSQVNGINNFPCTSTTNNASHFELENAALYDECRTSVTAINSLNQQEETCQWFQLQEEQPESFEIEEGSNSEQRKNDDFDCEQNQSRNSELQENELPAIHYLLQEAEALIQSIDITTDDQVIENKLSPVDLSLVRNKTDDQVKKDKLSPVDLSLVRNKTDDQVKKDKLSPVDLSLVRNKTDDQVKKDKQSPVDLSLVRNKTDDQDEKDKLSPVDLSLVCNKTDDQVKKNKLPPVDLSLVWNRKYFDSSHHVAFKVDHPFHYKNEYKRIRKSRLSVFDSVMSRQTNGPLSQRKVLEVIARPYYSIYPPTDEDDRRKCERSRRSGELMNIRGYLMLSLESIRTFDSYPLLSTE